MELMIGLMLAIPFGFFLRYIAQSECDRINEAWQAVADALGGHLTPSALHWLQPSHPTLYVKIDGVDLQVDTYSTGFGKNRQWFTRVTARAPRAGAESLKVYGQGLFTGLGRALGLQDVPVGDAAFDEDYVVKASDPTLAPIWLNEQVRARIRRAEGFRFEILAGDATAVVDGIAKDAPLLQAGVMAAAAFADGRQAILKRFDKLAERYGGRVDAEGKAWAALDTDVEGVAVSLSHDGRQGRVEARVMGPKVAAFAIRRDETATCGALEGYALEAGDEARAALDAELRELLLRSGGSRLEVDAERVSWKAAGAPTMRAWEAALQLTTRLARGAESGPYR